MPHASPTSTQGNTSVTTISSGSGKEKEGDGQEEGSAREMQSIGGGKSGSVSVFPLPNQVGAPCFDGTDISDFINEWEFMTMDWTESNRIKRLPQYCEKIIGRYLRTLAPFIAGTSWEDFKQALLLEFKEDDSEQTRNTENYLQNMVHNMRNEEDPSPARYRAFIFDFAERSNLLVSKSVIIEHTREIGRAHV